jgi:hypothetical protein
MKLFKQFQATHPTLKDFGFGPTYMIGETKQMLFPFMWTSLRPSSISLLNKTAIPTLSLTILFVDKLNDQENTYGVNGEDSNNGLEVLSDCFQIAQDFILYLGRELNIYGISLINDASLEPVEDESDDKLNGFALNIDLRLKHNNCSYDV